MRKVKFSISSPYVAKSGGIPRCETVTSEHIRIYANRTTFFHNLFNLVPKLKPLFDISLALLEIPIRNT